MVSDLVGGLDGLQLRGMTEARFLRLKRDYSSVYSRMIKAEKVLADKTRECDNIRIRLASAEGALSKLAERMIELQETGRLGPDESSYILTGRK